MVTVVVAEDTYPSWQAALTAAGQPLPSTASKAYNTLQRLGFRNVGTRHSPAYQLAGPAVITQLRKRRRAAHRRYQRTLRVYRGHERWVLATSRRMRRLQSPLTSADIRAILTSSCAVTGIQLDYHHTSPAPNSPTLMRIVPADGWVVGNVHIVALSVARRLQHAHTHPPSPHTQAHQTGCGQRQG